MVRLRFTLLLLSCALLVSLPVADQNRDFQPHQCRLWGMIANTLPEGIVYEHLINLPNSLKNLGYYNYNGWGIAYYNNCKPCALRGASSAYSDQNFNLAVQELAESNAHIAVGHVRLATSGASGIPNPHPFIRNKGSKWWAFGHNGDLSKTALKTLIGPEYLAQNPPTVGHDWDDPDVVDSDLYMLYLLKCIETKGWNATAGIAKAVIDITAVSSGAMNFFLTDGETLWGFCLGNTLYYYYNATFPCYSALASQYPTSAQDGWTELQDYSLVVLTRDDLPYVIDDVTTIPEFPLPTILPVLILITLLAVLMHKKNPLNSAKK